MQSVTVVFVQALHQNNRADEYKLNIWLQKRSGEPLVFKIGAFEILL